MISIGTQWLRTVAPGVVIETCPGLFVSSLYSFGGGGNAGKDTAMLDATIAAIVDCDDQVLLTLIGQADRYDVAFKRGARVVEICPDDHAQPTAAQARQIADVLLPHAYGIQPGIDALRERMQIIGGLQTDKETNAMAEADARSAKE